MGVPVTWLWRPPKLSWCKDSLEKWHTLSSAVCWSHHSSYEEIILWVPLTDIYRCPNKPSSSSVRNKNLQPKECGEGIFPVWVWSTNHMHCANDSLLRFPAHLRGGQSLLVITTAILRTVIDLSIFCHYRIWRRKQIILKLLISFMLLITSQGYCENKQKDLCTTK